MAYVGNTPTTQNFISGTDYFNGTGSQTAFTLSRTVASVNDIQAVVNNVVQVPNDAYTISGTTITFTSAPSAGTQNVYVRYLSTTTQAITPSQNTVSWNTLDTNTQNDLGLMGKNKIINGNMVISQRGTSPTITGGGECSVDRFYNYYSGNAYTSVQSTTAPAGFTNSLLLTVTTPSASPAYSFFGQCIEGLNITDLGWGTANAKTVTYSFWVRSSVAGAYSFSITNWNGTRAYPLLYTINAVDTWQYITATIPGDTSGSWLTDNNLGIRIRMSMGSTRSGTSGVWQAANVDGATGSTGGATWANTSGATFYITGVQFEIGTQATAFSTAGGSYGAELALCQRYCQAFRSPSSNYSSFGIAVCYSSGGARLPIPLRVPMRTTPSTLTASAGSTFLAERDSGGAWPATGVGLVPNCTPEIAQVVFESSTNSFPTGGAGLQIYSNNTTSAFLIIGAEL